MGVGHHEGSFNDAGQRCDIRGLLEDLVVHPLDQAFVGINDPRHAHVANRLDAPGRFVNLCETSKIHYSALTQTSTTQVADHFPSSSQTTPSAV